MQLELFGHFHSEGHNGFLQNCSITLIDKTDRSDPTRRSSGVWSLKQWVFMG